MTDELPEGWRTLADETPSDEGFYNPPDGERIAIAEPARDEQIARVVLRPFVYRNPSTIPVRPWVFGRHFMRGTVSADAGPPGVGKSFAALGEMLAMTSGRSLLGDAPPKPLRVWYWGEDPADEIDRRVLGAMKHYGIDPGEIEGRLFLNSAADTKLKIAIEKSGSFTIVSPIVDSLIDEFRSKSIDVAIVDPFVKTHGVQENDNGGIDQVVDLWASIARETNSAIDLIHHLKKLGGAEVTIDDVRGASAIVGAVRAVRLYAGMSEAEAKETNTENRRAFFKRRNGKANYFLPSDKWDWFLLENISLENGGDGPSDEVGVAVNWKWPNALVWSFRR